MRRLQATSVTLAFLAAVGLLLGSFAFAEATSDRGASVELAEDPDAYLGFEVTDEDPGADEVAVSVRYENRFTTALDGFAVDASVTDGAASGASVSGVPDSIDSGNAAHVTVTVDCESDGPATIRLEATTDGFGETDVSTTNHVDVTCVVDDGGEDDEETADDD